MYLLKLFKKQYDDNNDALIKGLLVLFTITALTTVIVTITLHLAELNYITLTPLFVYWGTAFVITGLIVIFVLMIIMFIYCLYCW